MTIFLFWQNRDSEKVSLNAHYCIYKCGLQVKMSYSQNVPILVKTSPSLIIYIFILFIILSFLFQSDDRPIINMQISEGDEAGLLLDINVFCFKMNLINMIYVS